MVMNTFRSKLRKRRDELFRRSSDDDADEWQFVPFNHSVFSGATIASTGSGRNNGSAKSVGLRPWALKRASWHDGAAPPVPPHSSSSSLLPPCPETELYPGSVPQWYGAQMPIKISNGSAYPQSVPSGQSRPSNLSPHSSFVDDDVLYRRPLTAKRPHSKPRPVSAGNIASLVPDYVSQVSDGMSNVPPIPRHGAASISTGITNGHRGTVSSPRHAPLQKSKSTPPVPTTTQYSQYSPRPLSTKSSFHVSNSHQNHCNSLAPVPDQREEDSSSPSPEYTLPVSCSSENSTPISPTPPPVPNHRVPLPAPENTMKLPPFLGSTLTPVHREVSPIPPPPGWTSSAIRPSMQSPPVPRHGLTYLRGSPRLQHRTNCETCLPERVPVPPPHGAGFMTVQNEARNYVPHNEVKPAVPPHFKPAIPEHQTIPRYSEQPIKDLRNISNEYSNNSSQQPPPIPNHLPHSLSCPSGPLPPSPESNPSQSSASCLDGPLPQSPESTDFSPSISLPPSPTSTSDGISLQSQPISQSSPLRCPTRSLPSSPVNSVQLSEPPSPRPRHIFGSGCSHDAGTSTTSCCSTVSSEIPVKPAVRRSHTRQSSLPQPPLYQNMHQSIDYQSNETLQVAYQRLENSPSIETLSLSNRSCSNLDTSIITSEPDISFESFASSSSHDSSRLSSRQSSQGSRHSPWFVPSPEEEVQNLLTTFRQHIVEAPVISVDSSSSSSVVVSPMPLGNSDIVDGQVQQQPLSIIETIFDKELPQSPKTSSNAGNNKSSEKPSGTHILARNTMDGLNSTKGENMNEISNNFELLQIIEEPELVCPTTSNIELNGGCNDDSQAVDDNLNITTSPSSSNITDCNVSSSDASSSLDIITQEPLAIIRKSPSPPLPQAAPTEVLSNSCEGPASLLSPVSSNQTEEATASLNLSINHVSYPISYASRSNSSNDIETSNLICNESQSNNSSNINNVSPSSATGLSLSSVNHLISLPSCLRSSAVSPLMPATTSDEGNNNSATEEEFGALCKVGRRHMSSSRRPRSYHSERPSFFSSDFATRFSRPRSLFSALSPTSTSCSSYSAPVSSHNNHCSSPDSFPSFFLFNTSNNDNTGKCMHRLF